VAGTNNRFALNAYIVAGLIVALGVLISVRANDWSWFGRSGSLIVINGIVLTSRQIIEHIQQLKQLQAKCGSHSQRDWAQNEKQQLLRSHHETLWKNEKYGLYMLIVGTLIWGFGDLPNLWLGSQ